MLCQCLISLINVKALHLWAALLQKERLRKLEEKGATVAPASIPFQADIVSRLEQRLNGMMDEMKCLQMELAELRGTMNLNEVDHRFWDQA